MNERGSFKEFLGNCYPNFPFQHKFTIFLKHYNQSPKFIQTILHILGERDLASVKCRRRESQQPNIL